MAEQKVSLSAESDINFHAAGTVKKAVVTGASGFIGKALTRELLERGWLVYAVVRSPEKLADIAQERLKIVQSDLTEYADLGKHIPDQGIDVFFHLAWDGTFGESFRDYHRQLKNAACAGDALMAAVQSGASRFLFIGTIVELEAKHYMLSDGGTPRFSCLYGTAKAAAGMVCRTLAYQLGMPYNGVVLASVYGEGDHTQTIQNVLISALQRGESPNLVDGKNLYDWIYIDDVITALIAIAEDGQPDKTYYVGHRELQTFEALVTRTRDVVAPGIPLTFGTLQDKTVTDYSLIDREVLYRDTGFVCRADFETSIKNTTEWLRQQGDGKQMSAQNLIKKPTNSTPPPQYNSVFLIFCPFQSFRDEFNLSCTTDRLMGAAK